MLKTHPIKYNTKAFKTKSIKKDFKVVVIIFLLFKLGSISKQPITYIKFRTCHWDLQSQFWYYQDF